MDKKKKREYFLKVFAGSDEGKIVLQELAEFCGDHTAVPSSDPRLDAYMLGRRSVLVEIRNIIKEKENGE